MSQLEVGPGAEAHYHALFVAAADAILVADDAGRYVDANPAAVRLLGYSRQELLGLGVTEVVARESDWTAEEYDRFRKQGRWSGRVSVRRKDGTIVPVESEATRVELPTGLLFLATLRDLTEREREEGALREQYVRSLVQHATDLVAVVSQDEAVRYASPAIAPLLGYDPGAVVGTYWLAVAHPDDRAAARQCFEAAAHRGVARCEARFRHRDGGWRTLELALSNQQANPRIGGFVVNARDVTERRRLTEAAARAEVLAASDKLKSALLAMVSHELRTPLATIKVAAGSLLDPALVWGEAERAELLRAIDTEADRLARTVDNLLDLSRIEGGVLRPDLGWHDVAELVAEVAVELGARAADHRVVAEVAPGLPPARFDRDQIARVLTNLGENAAKHTPPGTTVALSARALPGALELAVRDDGPGIAAEELPRVFERFYRGARSTSVPGAGIGLAICKGLVEAHGGRIEAESRQGEGTTVRVALPLDRAEEALA